MSDAKTLYIVVCAAGPAGDVGKLVDLALERGWTVQLISTPTAIDFIDAKALEKQTGRPVRSHHRKPGSPRSPKADAIVIAPATFNTINKLANGIADTYALDIVNEGIGLEVPIVILPFVNLAYAERKPFKNSVDNLREENVNVLLGGNYFRPHKAGSGGSSLSVFPWSMTLDVIEDVQNRSAKSS